MDLFLYIAGTIATAVLAAICISLSLRKQTATFITVGQDVFRWMTSVLIVIIVTRLLLLSHIVDSPSSRMINSFVFIGAVIGICWSVLKHGKSQ